MFDPQNYHKGDDGEWLFKTGMEVYRNTSDEDLAIPLIKAASDRGWLDASHFLARYFLRQTDYPDPYISKFERTGIDYRKAAEFALAGGCTDLLDECFSKCALGELDDIKARMGQHCKNYDSVRKICVLGDAECGPVERDWCEWGSYTSVSVSPKYHY